MGDFFSVGPSSSDIDAAIGSSWYELPADIIDANKVSVATSPAMPWWQQMIQTGVSKVIDNQLARAPAAGSISPGTAAGQNGQTYQQTATPTAPTVGAAKAAGVGVPWVALGVGLVLAMLVMRA
jgi:hypothetical protein